MEGLGLKIYVTPKRKPKADKYGMKALDKAHDGPFFATVHDKAQKAGIEVFAEEAAIEEVDNIRSGVVIKALAEMSHDLAKQHEKLVNLAVLEALEPFSTWRPAPWRVRLLTFRGPNPEMPRRRPGDIVRKQNQPFGIVREVNDDGTVLIQTGESSRWMHQTCRRPWTCTSSKGRPMSSYLKTVESDGLPHLKSFELKHRGDWTKPIKGHQFNDNFALVFNGEYAFVRCTRCQDTSFGIPRHGKP